MNAHKVPFIRRIAEEKIKAYGLSDTVDQYITKCLERTEAKYRNNLMVVSSNLKRGVKS
jgi:DNA-directed RNA polymerase specialized sigma54-like protein